MSYHKEIVRETSRPVTDYLTATTRRSKSGEYKARGGVQGNTKYLW